MPPYPTHFLEVEWAPELSRAYSWGPMQATSAVHPACGFTDETLSLTSQAR